MTARSTRRAQEPARRKSSKAAREAQTPTEADSAAAANAIPAVSHEPPRKPATASREPRSRGNRTPAKSRQSVEVLLAGKLEAMLRESEDGLSTVAISKSANARGSQVRGLLRELETGGQVRRVGASRATRWQLITDEERVAQRAAELESRSAAKP